MSDSQMSPTIPAVFYRGGTSNALMIHRRDLPEQESAWGPILAGAIGSPDPYQRQLNGMGGGVSSLSKVCVIDESRRQDADIDYTFIQMGVADGRMDTAGTCGNMTSAIGPFALDEGILNGPVAEKGPNGTSAMTVRIFNTNTSKIIHSSFAVQPAETGSSRYCFQPHGSYSIDGVPGTGSRISMSFLNPGGSKTGKTLPTGVPLNTLILPGNQSTSSRARSIPVSLVDVGNPAVIVAASALGIPGEIRPEDLDNDKTTMELLEEIRKQGSEMMGMKPVVDSIPKMVLVSPAKAQGGNKTVDLTARVLSMGRCHKAIPLTISLNLGVACNIPGTIPYDLCQPRSASTDTVTIGHPSGVLQVGARMKDGDVESGILHRTARPLMKGDVYWK